MRSLPRKKDLHQWVALGYGVLFFVAAAGPVASSAQAGVVEVPGKGKSKTVDRIRQQQALRAGVVVYLPWLGQNPRSGEFFGPAIEIGERIAKLLEVKLKPVTTNWDVVIAGLQANQFELALAPLLATEKRRQVVDFVNYTQGGMCYVVLRDNVKINTLEDLNQPSVTFGTWAGTGSEQGIRAKYTNAKIHSLVPVGGATRIEDVLTRRVDAAPIESARAFVTAHQYPQTKILPGGPEHCVKNPDVPTPIGIALNYGDPEFKQFLEAVAADMQEEINASVLKHSSLEMMLQK